MSISARSKSFLHLLQEVENLRLNRDVERRCRLVGDEQQRLARQRDGDEHALAHPSRQLMRVVAQPPRRVRNPDGLEQLDRLRARALPRAPSCGRAALRQFDRRS